MQLKAIYFLFIKGCEFTKYTNFEIDDMLKSMVVLIDTREQDTQALHERIETMNCPTERVKLDYGDYSVKTVLLTGEALSLACVVAVERKMNLDELCQCFTKGRERFEREFERAKADNARVYLLIEKSDWEKVFAGKYRSQLKPQSLVASLLAWAARYSLIPQFCEPKSTGRLIYSILRYELKSYLERIEVTANDSSRASDTD